MEYIFRTQNAVIQLFLYSRLGVHMTLLSKHVDVIIKKRYVQRFVFDYILIWIYIFSNKRRRYNMTIQIRNATECINESLSF